MSVRDQIQELVEQLVAEPDEVEIDEIDDGDEIVFEAFVAQGDLGKVIGRQGRTARSIRTLLGVRGERDGQRYGFEIVED